MRFLIRKRRTAPAVIIVALIDVLIVLVIFLLVTTTFKQQPSVHITLPKSSQALKPGATENPPLLVSIDKDGLLRLGANDEPVTLERLERELAAHKAKQAEAKFAVRADKNAPWGKMVEVMDLSKKLAINNLSVVTEEANKP